MKVDGKIFGNISFTEFDDFEFFEKQSQVLLINNF